MSPRSTLDAIRSAIRESEIHDQIEWVGPYIEPEALAYLQTECDGSVEANGVHEFWADDPESDEKMTWRVHVRIVEAGGL